MTFSIEKHLLALPGTDKDGFRMELNLISWNNRKPKYDLRGWNSDHTQMTKGITLTDEEFTYLKEKIGGLEA